MRLDLSVLNPEQLAAVTAGDGPLLVLAGAGTGKTRVITYRMAQLIRSGEAGDRILAITFTNRAASEMEERLLRMYPELDPRPTICTFHALGLRILREEHERIGFRRRFPIYDDSDTQDLITEVLRDLAGVAAAEAGVQGARRAISNWKNRFVPPEAAIDQAADDATYLMARAYAHYQERLRGLNAVDFDDLIFGPVRLFEEFPEVARAWQDRFRHVLIDEYQDTNTAQYRFARVLAGERENLCVVGDDDQSIYAFRGAEVEKILSFRKDFPRAKVVTLEQNYRSVGTILEAANAVIANNPRRHAKRLQSARGPGRPIPLLLLENEEAEAEEIVFRVLDARRRGVPCREQAILLRSAIQARPFEEKLRFHGVEYTIIGGQSFFDRREVKDLFAYLRLVVTPEDDIAALRILNTPRRGWGKTSRERLDTWAREHGVSILEALRRVEQIAGVPAAARSASQLLVAAIDRAAATVDQGAVAATQRLCEDLGFEQALREVSADSQDLEFRRKNVTSVLQSIERYEERAGTGHLTEYLQSMSLRRDTQSSDETGDVLTLLTFHGAKGLEFAHVYLVGIEEELIPHRRAVAEDPDRGLEEERRLFYVALTRARDHLTLSRAILRRRFGKDFETLESRFVAEIPDSVLERQSIRHEDQPAASGEQVADFMAQLRARFA
ncbi:MAG: ATP-dependent helicase [Planctomycetota bacterium]